jgi:hypothetical protein
MWRLKSHHAVPPGGFYYEQFFEANGRKLRKRWASTPEIGMLASKVASFRKGNSLPRAVITEALEDIVASTVARIVNNPKWCFDTDIPWSDIVAAEHGAGCRTCGGTPLVQ